MNRLKTTLSLSLMAAITTLIYACQQEAQVRERRIFSPSPQGAQTGQETENNESDATQSDATTNPVGQSPRGSYQMSWNISADPEIISYKVYIVPPDRNVRFSGKTDVPIEIMDYAIDELQQNGEKYSVTVGSDLIKAALGTTGLDPAAYCFTVVSVNEVGNSIHSPAICP